MKKIIITFIAYFLCASLHAEVMGQPVNVLVEVLKTLMKMEGIQGNILNNQTQELSVNRDILSTQRDINNLIRDFDSNIKGNYGWGWFRFVDYQSYGDSANDWASVIRLTDAGSGAGQLGLMIGGIRNQFPMDKSTFNRGIADPRIQAYYALKSQTILAIRAASLVDYDKIKAQIEYQHMLQYQIEQSPNLKAALDLNNRLQVENNLIQLEILRQIALTNQQQAVSEQASLNAALSLAKFLTKE